MLKSCILVDLPSQERLREVSSWDRFLSLFGVKPNLASGVDELTVGAVALLNGVFAAFRQCGVQDVMSLIVDQKLVYFDEKGVESDVELADAALKESGILCQPFKEMRMGMSHQHDGLHTLIDVRLSSQVKHGSPEMRIDLSSRILACGIEKGETAKAYAERISEFAKNTGALEFYVQTLRNLATQLATGLDTTLPGTTTQVLPVKMQIIRPTAKQLRQLPSLGFGDKVLTPPYRPQPNLLAYGPDDVIPLSSYYQDPYQDFCHFVLYTCAPAWSQPFVEIVTDVGQVLFSGAETAQHPGEKWVEAAVQFDESGGLRLDDSALHRADHDSPWAGEHLHGNHHPHDGHPHHEHSAYGGGTEHHHSDSPADFGDAGGHHHTDFSFDPSDFGGHHHH